MRFDFTSCDAPVATRYQIRTLIHTVIHLTPNDSSRHCAAFKCIVQTFIATFICVSSALCCLSARLDVVFCYVS